MTPASQKKSLLGVASYHFLRLLLWLVTRTIYRVHVVGGENLPARGPALLVSNHLSFVDGLILSTATSRPIRFVVHKVIAGLPFLRWAAKVLRVIPVSPEDGPRSVLASLEEAGKALEAGELVCIFPEGQISRTGQLLSFRSGTERILKISPAPVIPAHLDQVWGSIFSFSGRRFFWKLPRRIPYPVTVSFGRQLPAQAPVEEIRQAVQDLGSDAFEHRKRAERPLPWSFFQNARRHFFAPAMVDSTGKSASYGKLAAGVVHLARILSKPFEDQEMVGIVLPPSVAAAAVNVAASLLGKPVVNLNYTASSDSIQSALLQCRIKRVISSRAFLEKIKLEVPAELVFLEDILEARPRLSKAADAAAAWLLPSSLLRWWIGARKIGMDDLVTVLFSSGSTGEPKGVMLTHFNILSNIQGVTQVLELSRRDRVLGVLPFFHATGYMGGLWTPLLLGMTAVYHSNPLDARTVGELVKRHGVTILFATPTFLKHYARRCAPEDFGSVVFTIAGAEKLLPPVSDLYRERFGVEPMEGYGCTEASPMVSVNVPDVRHRGIFQIGGKRGTVGRPLPGVSVRVVDPDTGERLPPGTPGVLLVKGPNIMRGYLGKPELTAEVLKEGWYRTGDIAFLDDEGFITITDRISRFSKIGGEMVPHLKVEEALHHALGLDEQAFCVTSLPDSEKGERLAVVHTVPEERLPELFEKLLKEGLPNLWIPRKEAFVRVQEIPRLGTGKVDFRGARKMAEEALEGRGG